MMNERIRQLMEYDGLTAVQFSKKVNINTSAISHLLNGRNNPSFENIQKIIAAYPNLNVKWFMTGQGDIFTESESSDWKESSEYGENEDNLFGLFDKSEQQSGSKVEYAREIGSNSQEIEAKFIVNQNDKSQKSKPVPIKKVVVFYMDNTYEEFLSTIPGRH